MEKLKIYFKKKENEINEKLLKKSEDLNKKLVKNKNVIIITPLDIEIMKLANDWLDF